MDEMNHCIEMWMPVGQQKTLPVPDQTRCRAERQSDSAIRCREGHGACTEIPGCLPDGGVGVGIHTCIVFFLKIAGSLLFLLPWDIGYNYIPAPVHPYVTIIKSL